jgi:hypothetical protein
LVSAAQASAWGLSALKESQNPQAETCATFPSKRIVFISFRIELTRVETRGYSIVKVG